MKKCIDCDIEKEDSFFWNRKQCSDGLSKFCKACGAIRNKKYHEDIEKKIELKSIHIENNIELIIQNL